MDPNNPSIDAFWQAFDTPQAARVLARSAVPGPVTVEELRRNLAAALSVASVESRQAMQQAIGRGTFICSVGSDDMNFITYEARLFDSRIISGTMVTRSAVQQTITKECRSDAPYSWEVEVAFANRVAELQKKGGLKGLVVPVWIDPVHKLISFKQCRLEGKIAPTLDAYLKDSQKLKEKVSIWCQAADILVDLHTSGLMHGDFCSSQICMTDEGPILLDLESMLDCQKDIYLQLTGGGEVRVSQFVGNNIIRRFTRDAYYDWTQVAKHYCHEPDLVRIRSSVARQAESRAFATNMLEHLVGTEVCGDVVAMIEKIHSCHRGYFEAHQNQESEVLRVLTEIVVLLIGLKTIHFRENPSFTKTVKTLRMLCDQLPS